MSNVELQLSEDKYETKLWISRDFIERYHQLPFYDIIQHSEKYEDGSYYIDMPFSSMKNVIDLLIDDNKDISSLNLKESYDIYQTLVDYSVTIDKGIQSDFLIHIKQLFYNYLNENNYDIDGCYCNYFKSHMPMDLFSLEEKKIFINGLITPQRKDEFLYYSLLIKMMNITKVEITYDYSSTIPVEYICPSCIKDIFPSLKEINIAVNTHYKKTNQLLNPNSDEYIMEYIRLFNENDYKIDDSEKYEYYTETDMNEYDKISSLILKSSHYYYHNSIDSYNGKRRKTELPKLYKYVVNEAIYTNNNLNFEIHEIEDGYVLKDIVMIKYTDKTSDKTFTINKISSKHGISQLLLLPSYLFISKIILNEDFDYQNKSMVFKLLEESVFDSLTTLNVAWIKKFINKIDENLFDKIMTTHVFPNVTELIYDDYSNKLSLIKKECFPKLHIINYNITIIIESFEYLFPVNLISRIDTIYIHNIDYDQKESIAILLDNLIYTHSIQIDISDLDIASYANCFPHLNELLEKNLISINYLDIDFFYSETIRLLDSIENNNQNIDSLCIQFQDNNNDDDSGLNEMNIRNSLERFLKSNALQNLNYLTVLCDYTMSIEYLTWISTLFNNNKFNNIRELTMNLASIEEDSLSEYLNIYENILEKLIPKASSVYIEGCSITFINRLIHKGCFHNTTQLILDLLFDDIPDDNFCKLYTTINFPQLKSIKFCKAGKEWFLDFIKIFCRYINNNNFLSSKSENDDHDDYVYDPNNSILRCKYDTHSFMNTIIGNKGINISYKSNTLI
ncbi:hypothetical protein WA158_003603 [Blastocystis sp. Blastoise]